MKKHIILLLISITLILSLQAEKKKTSKLPSKYKKWLEEEVVYIIAKKEKEVFLQLESDKEREIFIEAFWKHRDPTPGTQENEFKVEHYRRINYANKFFGRETHRPGWKTDRGRIYIILGEPISIDKFEGLHQIHSTHIWFYQGSPEYGLPASFNIVFFQREGMGEHVLYSPSQDGPYSLLSYIQTQMDAIDITAIYNKLWEIEPTVAANSLSLIPGEQLLPGQVSLASDILLSTVHEFPQKKISPSYAEALLRYKDIVEVEYTANYIESDYFIKIIKDKSGIFFVHYSIEPERLSLNAYEDKYYTNFKINGNIQDLKGRIIFQYEKNIPLEFSKNQIEYMGNQAFALQDMFPLLGGNYKFSLLLKNTVAKEFTSFEKDVFIPLSLSSLQMGSMLLGYKAVKIPSPSTMRPFQVGANQIWAQPRKIFLPKEKLSVFFQIMGLTRELEKNGSFRFAFYKGEEEIIDRIKNINEYPEKLNFIEEFDLEKFSPGFYEIKIAVLDRENNEVLYKKENFEITPVQALPRPLVISKSIPLSKNVIYLHMLGIQWLNKGEMDKAKDYLEKAYHQNPDEVRFALDLGRAHFLLREFKQVKEILLNFFNDNVKNFSVLELLAKSCQSLSQFDEAIVYFKEYLSHYGTNLEILNSIGECYFKIGDLDEALYAWEKSLEINPEQERIREKIKLLREKKQ